MFYKNKYSKFLKTYDNEFYFYKKRTKEYHDWLWTGLYVNKMDDVGDIRNITVSFDIKLLKKIIKWQKFILIKVKDIGWF